jgi:hypothetical protein
MNAPVGFFSGTNNLDASSKLPNFPAGFTGVVKVDLCKGITSRVGKRAFIAEVTVLESNLTDSADKRVSVGSRYSWYQDLSEPGTSYPSCIGFLYACLGISKAANPDEVAKVLPKQDEYLNKAVDEKTNLLGGSIIGLQTSLILTKQGKAKAALDPKFTPIKGDVFTLHTFTPGPAVVS